MAMECPCIELGVASRALTGETEIGDRYLAKPDPAGALLCVVDGLGHGPEAAMAAALAIETLAQCGAEPVTTLVQRCHERLRRTRGVVMSLASIRVAHSTLTWVGVGNVDGLLVRSAPTASLTRETLLLRGGVVGYRLPSLRAATLPIAPGDLLVFATDGISSGFAAGVNHAETPQRLADRLLTDFGKRTDDALVLVARYLGAGA